MKIAEINAMSASELAERIAVEVANYDQMKLNHAVAPLENNSQIKAANMQTRTRWVWEHIQHIELGA